MYPRIASSRGHRHARSQKHAAKLNHRMRRIDAGPVRQLFGYTPALPLRWRCSLSSGREAPSDATSGGAGNRSALRPALRGGRMRLRPEVTGSLRGSPRSVQALFLSGLARR